MSRQLRWAFSPGRILDYKSSTFLFDRDAYLFVGEETVIVHILELDRTIEGNSHSYFLVRSVRQHFEDQYLFELLCHLHKESSVGASRRFNCSREIRV